MIHKNPRYTPEPIKGMVFITNLTGAEDPEKERIELAKQFKVEPHEINIVPFTPDGADEKVESRFQTLWAAYGPERIAPAVKAWTDSIESQIESMLGLADVLRLFSEIMSPESAVAGSNGKGLVH